MFRSFPLLLLVFLSALPALSTAQNQRTTETGFTRFAEHTVYHSVFSSTAIRPEIAVLHGLTRAGNHMLVNVALVSNDRQFGGEPAHVSGSVSNLLNQRRELNFKTIDEGDVVYYLAPVRVTEQDTLHFTLKVAPESGASAYEVKFTKRVYVNH